VTERVDEGGSFHPITFPLPNPFLCGGGFETRPYNFALSAHFAARFLLISGIRGSGDPEPHPFITTPHAIRSPEFPAGSVK
jgi:hypothetical protein